MIKWHPILQQRAMADRTSINISYDLQDRLRACKRGDDTYEDVIERHFQPRAEDLRRGGYDVDDEGESSK